jgi:hypothetical protein
VSNVVGFRRPKSQPVTALRVAEQKSPPKLSEIKGRGAWKKALASIWANPKNWRRSRNDSAYIVIDDLDLCVVIVHDEHGFKWEIRWSDGEEPTVSRWTYVGEQIAINEAWDAVCVLS